MEVASLRIKEAAEDGIAVWSGKAKPVDRPAFVNMGGDVAIADESVGVHPSDHRRFPIKVNCRRKYASVPPVHPSSFAGLREQ